MAACIVCNQQTMPAENLQDVGHMNSLCARLQKVLEEAVPEEAVLCAPCQCDLAQIEMYYSLLMVFKKRYSESVKLRLESQTHETCRNLLHETVGSSSNNSHKIFKTRELTDNCSTPLPLQPHVSSETSVVKGEIHNVLTLKDELASKNQTNIEDESEIEIRDTQQLSSHTDTFPDSNSPPNNKKRGRQRKNEQSNVSVVRKISGRKRGRPRKNEQLMGTPPKVATKGLRNSGRPRKESELAQTRGFISMKGGQLRNNEPLSKSIYLEESESEECSIGEDSDETETDGPKPSLTLRMANLGSKGCMKEEIVGNETTCDSETESYKAKRSIDSGTAANKIYGNPKKDGDPGYVVRNKRARPKKTEEDAHPTYTCTLCDKLFISRSRLKAHMQTHTSDRPFVCSVCSKAFRSIGHLNAHMKYHMADRPFKCGTCGKGFLRKIHLEKHIVAHSDVRPFQCDNCEKRFKSPRQLEHHKKCHHVDGRKYLCNVCGLALLSEGSLRSHMKTHSEARPFRCETCGRGFSTKAYLINHELVHKADTREKYLCPICGKELLQKSYLPLHMRQHTGQSKHTCSICQKSFSTSSTYKRHLLIHSGEKPHTCSECGKGFTSKGNLTAHIMSHTDERPFQCSCGQGFRSKAKMLKHMQTNKNGDCGRRSENYSSLTRPVTPTMSVATCVPVPTPGPTVGAVSVPASGPTLEPVSVPALLPMVAPPPVLAPLALAEQQDTMSAYQTDPLYLGL